MISSKRFMWLEKCTSCDFKKEHGERRKKMRNDESSRPRKTKDEEGDVR